jgi:flagellar assembly factor FliW
MPLSRLNRFKRSSYEMPPFEVGLVFPNGLHGFESLRRFSLVVYEHEAPFLRLVSLENEAITFMLIDPFSICPSYEPVITKQDIYDLQVGDEAKLIMLAIVNTHERPIAMNLEAPLLIHWHLKRGKQLLFPNESAYPIEKI